MKFAAGVLILLIAPPAARRLRAVPPEPAPLLPSIPAASLPAVGASQEWLGDPVLPMVFQFEAEESRPESFNMPPLLVLDSPTRQEPPPPSRPSPVEEPAFPKGVSALDIQAWREEDDLRRIREWAGDALFGLPLFVPQLVLESLLPRGIAVGPTTFLYRTSSAPPSLALVVFDQILFHEAQFLAQAQAYASDGIYAEGLQHGQRRVLRQSLMSGFRATYAMPRLTMDLILQTAEEQGVLGYVLAPPIAGALLYMKGLDQKVQVGGDIRVHFKLASGSQWVHGVHSDLGDPAMSFELRFCDFPVGILASFEVSSRGMTPAFIGLGTSLDAVEELLSREAASSGTIRPR
jgi:hypothetical protein